MKGAMSLSSVPLASLAGAWIQLSCCGSGRATDPQTLGVYHVFTASHFVSSVLLGQ